MEKNVKYIGTFVLFFFWLLGVGTPKAQVAEHEDTLKYVLLSEVEIFSKELTEEEKREYRRLVYNVRRTYPYARMAGERFKMYEDTISEIKNKKNRRRYIKQLEEEIRRDFLEDLKNMTVSQGKVLFKLISRQTGKSSYEIVKDLKSGIAAFGYQILGSMFGYNLKNGYNSEEEAVIESVVRLIENGEVLEITPQIRPAIAPKSKGKTSKKQRSVYYKKQNEEAKSKDRK